MFLQICEYLHNLQIKYGGKDMKKILSIILILLLAVLCLGSCVNFPSNGGSSTTPSTTKPTTTTPVEEKYTLSFEAEGIESLEVVDGKAIGNLPAVPENPGYTGLWKIDGEVINAGTIYNYGEDKTAVPFYIAKDDTVYTVQVFIQVEDSYEDVSAQYAPLFGECIGTTGATVDISELAQANLPAHCILNTEDSVLSGTIAGDGSLVLKVYYDLDGAFVLSFDVEGVASLPVKFGEPMTNLPAVPEKVGYTGVWKIADEVITAETVYNYNGSRTATAVYTANTDTLYTVEVYMNGANVSFDFGTQFGMPCAGTTDTIADISALAQSNIPAHCALDESNSVLTGTIAGDGSLVLKVYYYNTDTVIFDAVADTNVVLDYEVRYGADEYSHRVQFHRTAWNGTVQLKLNGNRPVAPEGTTHVTFYYYTAHTSYNSVLNASGKEITVGNWGTIEWKSFKLSIAQYNESVWTLTDPQGNSQGKYIYLSNPVFTTESQVWDGISTTTDVVYGTDEFSYTFNSNPTITATKVLLNMLGDADAISFYIRGTIAAPFNLVIFDPWDANTNLANTVAGEWVKFTLTREQVLNLVNNPSNYYLQIRSWDGGTYHISSFYEVKGPHIYTNYVYNNDAKCGVDGTETAQCDHCDKMTHTRPAAGTALSHSFEAYVSNNNATCTSNATETASCAHSCGATDTREIANSTLSHAFTSYVSNNDAKCGVDGTKTAKCDNCDAKDTKTDEDSALTHSYTNYVSNNDAKCEANGTETATCYHGCGTTHTREDIDSALTHSYTNYVYNNDATYEADGTETASCDHGCGKTDTRIKLGSMLSHIYTNYVYNNDAKCGVDGTKTAKCDEEGCDATDTVVAEGTALSHSYTNYVSNNDATCSANGTETASCDHGCGTTDTREDDNSTVGHVYTKYEYNNDAAVNKNGTETASCDFGCGTKDTREVANTALSIFDVVADTTISTDSSIVYGDQSFSYKVQFHATAWNGTVQFKLNGNRPAAPEDATHVTFYYYTAHTSYNSVLNAAGKEITVGNFGTLEWKSFKLSIAQYNNAVWTLTDPQGNSQGKYIYLSNPVFTTESQVWDGISTTTDVVYGTDEFSYTFNSNPTITATKVLLNMLGDADAISFYIRGTIAAPFNLVIFDPWDANTNLANTVAGEWVKFTLTREQVLNLVNNPSNYYLQIRSWDGGSYYISSSYETYSAPLFEALADTSVEADTLNVYGDQAESYRVKFHATAWNGTVTFKLNQSKLPAIPEEATHVSIWYYMDHVTYNGCTLKIGSKTVVMENAEPYGWKEIRMTVAEYQSLISETWYLQDANGNSQGKFIYFSAPVFTTDLTPFNGLEKSTEVVYGNDEFSYKFEGNPFITAGAGLLKLLGDNNEISFYIQGNINAPFNFVINDPWDANTNLANTVAGEWVKFTLTREQVLNLVNNPSNFSVAIRDWSGGTRLFYISSYYEVK